MYVITHKILFILVSLELFLFIVFLHVHTHTRTLTRMNIKRRSLVWECLVSHPSIHLPFFTNFLVYGIRKRTIFNGKNIALYACVSDIQYIEQGKRELNFLLVYSFILFFPLCRICTCLSRRFLHFICGKHTVYA